MEILVPLWFPIVVSTIVVFVVSSLVWMVLPHHKKDIKVLPDEKALTEHLKQLSIPPGTYMWPGCGSSAEMKSQEYKARYEAGPWGSINVLGKKANFGLNLALVFIFYLVVSIFVGYITSLARPAGEPFLAVFRVAGATAVLGYCAGSIPGAIFLGKPVRFVLTDFIDNLVYALLTGLIFAWLWPGATTPIT
jgi:hypothetical protein